MSSEPFTRTEQMLCVYHDRTKGESFWQCKIELSPTPPPPPPPSNNLLTVTKRCFCCGLLYLPLYVFACMSC